jgi:hypothetical protein
MKKLLVGIAALLCALLAPVPVAGAAGGPVVGMDAGMRGTTAPGAGVRFFTAPTLGKTVGPPRGRTVDRTLVMRVARDGGRVENYRYLRGTLTIPSVAYDYSTTGLSADGRALVLAKPRVVPFQHQSTFAVLDAKTLAPERIVRLRGDFSLDGVSPDGRRIYLIHYTLVHGNPGSYEVRAFDLSRGALDPKPIVDPREPDEQMQGTPITRATSADGRWAYTLYAGDSGTPFLHALDTKAGSARCVDLDPLKNTRNPMSLRLSSAGSGLIVTQGSQPRLMIDPKSFEVTNASVGGSDGPPWVLLIGATAAGLAASLLLLLPLRRRRPATT